MPALSLATRDRVYLRMLLIGATGSGKSCTAIRFATAIAKRYGGRIGWIDTEHRRSREYAGTIWAPDGFYPYDLPTGNPQAYINALGIMAKDRGENDKAPPMSVVIVDSLSDAWQGEGGTLETVGEKAQFDDWRSGKKPNYSLMRTIEKAPYHVIATCLADTQYLIKTDEQGKIKKGDGINVVGTRPIQDKKLIPKFNIQCSLDEYHNLTVIRTSYSPYDRIVVNKPGEEFITPLLDWVDSGNEPEGFKAEVRAASLEQIQEYYELQKILGNGKDTIIPAFYRKYASKPEDCTEEFLEDRLVELREKVSIYRKTKGGASSTVVNPPTKKNGGTTASTPADENKEGSQTVMDAIGEQLKKANNE